MFDYQNSALSADARAADLLRRMTLEEKAAQTCMMRGVEYATKPEPRHFCSVAPDTVFDTAQLEADFGADGIGFVHDMYSTPVPFNILQRYFIERLLLVLVQYGCVEVSACIITDARKRVHRIQVCLNLFKDQFFADPFLSYKRHLHI